MLPMPSHPFARLHDGLCASPQWLSPFELGRAFPRALFTLSGVAIEMRFDRRLHSEPIQLREPRASCAPSAETRSDFRRRISLVPRLAPRARSPRRSFADRSLDASFRLLGRFVGRAYTGRLGARRCGARLGERAFHDARTAGRIDRGRVGSVRPCTRSKRLRPGCLCRLLRRDRDRDFTERDRRRRPPRSSRHARS
jgi:hypothetical protein